MKGRIHKLIHMCNDKSLLTTNYSEQSSVICVKMLSFARFFIKSLPESLKKLKITTTLVRIFYLFYHKVKHKHNEHHVEILSI